MALIIPIKYILGIYRCTQTATHRKMRSTKPNTLLHRLWSTLLLKKHMCCTCNQGRTRRKPCLYQTRSGSWNRCRGYSHSGLRKDTSCSASRHHRRHLTCTCRFPRYPDTQMGIRICHRTLPFCPPLICFFLSFFFPLPQAPLSLSSLCICLNKHCHSVVCVAGGSFQGFIDRTSPTCLVAIAFSHCRTATYLYLCSEDSGEVCCDSLVFIIFFFIKRKKKKTTACPTLMDNLFYVLLY